MSSDRKEGKGDDDRLVTPEQLGLDPKLVEEVSAYASVVGKDFMGVLVPVSDGGKLTTRESQWYSDGESRIDIYIYHTSIDQAGMFREGMRGTLRRTVGVDAAHLIDNVLHTNKKILIVSCDADVLSKFQEWMKE